MSVTVRGADRVAAALGGLAAGLEDPRLVRAAADDIAAAARRLAPVAAGQPNAGQLRRSIVVNPGRSGPVVWVKAWARYSTFVEEGTRYMPARPFLLPAARAERVAAAVDRRVDQLVAEADRG